MITKIIDDINSDIHPVLSAIKFQDENNGYQLG